MHLIYFVVTLIYFIIWNNIDSYRDYIFIFILHRMIHIIHSFFILFLCARFVNLFLLFTFTSICFLYVCYMWFIKKMSVLVKNSVLNKNA